MNSINTFIPGAVYYFNPTTQKMELTEKTVDYDAVIKTVQEQFEELKDDPLIQSWGLRRFLGMPTEVPFNKSHVEIARR